MTQRFAVECVVLDIEGTTSATGFVTDVLYPYSRERLRTLLTERSAEPDVARAISQVRTLLDDSGADAALIEKTLTSWLDEDRKATPLKTLQGVIWAEGFARGDLVSHLYDDVTPALRAWHTAGLRLQVYSSGSVAAQRAWFGHTAEGDLLPLFQGLYDTENAGPKNEPDSYRAIGGHLGTPAAHTLFLSDRRSELDAARAAGWRTLGVCRPGEPYHAQGVGDHPHVLTFDEITLTRSPA